MPLPVLIDNPILNSPFAEPTSHFRFDADNRITADVAAGRRPSASYLPVAAPKKKVKQPDLFAGVDEKRVENVFVNRVRQKVKLWRDRGHPHVTPATRLLLEHWAAPGRVRQLFFCQVEAVETLIFLTEVAKQTTYGDDWIEEELRDAAAAAGTALFRLACKMATGSGKTAVMSMLVAWHTLNKRRRPKDNRFTDSFLVVAPGVTVRDRLRVLLPSDPNNYYRGLDIVPAELMPELGTARLVVTNFHAFQEREFGDAGGLTKRLLTVNTPGAFTETPDQMVARVCRELGTRREIIVLNDEAHHCYRRNPLNPRPEKLTGDDKKDADRRDEESRMWLTGLEAVHRKLGVKAVYDLSATPFYLKGSGYPEGTLFPWVVSDFSLIDAIESGVVKVPRVPVADNALAGDYPKYRNLWVHIRDGLPKKGQQPAGSQWVPPMELQGALESLYGHYQARFDEWERDPDARAAGRTPPVFIVVCNNTTVSRLVFEYVAGRETEHTHPDGAAVAAPGKLPLFSNVRDNRWLHRPNTILVDSEQLDSDAGLSAEFKAAAGAEIETFKADYRTRYPGRGADALTDEDLMREVLNTVGKPGKLGEQVRCVVSVSMLTEGWDANTVTHVLGLRAFGTQLLCEQVVGRGLRRMSYALNDQGRFDPEYADVYGVPFAFIPCAGIGDKRDPKAVQKPGRVQAVPERLVANPHLEITFPKLLGYRYEVPAEVLRAEFDKSHEVVLTTTDIPTRIENAPLVGQMVVLTLDHLKAIREQEVAFKLAAHLQQTHFPHQVWLLPQLVAIVRRWMAGGVDYGDETFPGMLLFAQKAHQAAEKISQAISKASGGADRVRATLPDDGATGTTIGVSYDTLRTVWTTDEEKCHLNLVPEDSGWETKVVAKLERMSEVRAYVKNQNLGFRIPYTHEGRPGNYHPDLIAKVADGRGDADLLNLVIEVSGQKKADKDAKVATARELWVPAVNNERRFGRWAFVEVVNPDKAMQSVRAFLAGYTGGGGAS